MRRGINVPPGTSAGSRRRRRRGWRGPSRYPTRSFAGDAGQIPAFRPALSVARRSRAAHCSKAAGFPTLRGETRAIGHTAATLAAAGAGRSRSRVRMGTVRRQIRRAAPIRGRHNHWPPQGRNRKDTAHEKGIRPPRRRPRERGRGPDLRRARRRKSRRRGVAAHLADRIDPHASRAGRRLHGGDAWTADRAARRLHLDARARRAQFFDRRRLCPSRRHADDHDHRPEGDHDRQAGALPDRRRRRLDEAADQDDAADRQRRTASRPSCAMPSGWRWKSGPARCIWSFPRTSRASEVPSIPSIPVHPLERPRRPSRRDRSRGADDPGGQASAGHDRRRRQSSAAGRRRSRTSCGAPASRSSTRRWARAPSTAARTSMSGRRRFPSATMCTMRSSFRT